MLNISLYDATCLESEHHQRQAVRQEAARIAVRLTSAEHGPTAVERLRLRSRRGVRTIRVRLGSDRKAA